MTDLKCLTTTEVARLCRVSDATVKRWEDAGLLKSERTSGGHRRFRAEEVLRFQREQNLGLKQNHGDDSVIKSTIRTRDAKSNFDYSLLQSLLAGSEEAATNFLVGAHLEGKALTEIIDLLICPAMQKVGEMWFAGEISITREHLATRAVYSAVHKLRCTLPVPEMRDELAMCCAMEGDFHELPTHLAQITIENEGFEVVNFGANTPLFSLAEEVVEYAPRFVCISATVINDLERLSRDYKDFKEQISKLKIPVVCGGRVFVDEPVRRRFPADFYAHSFAEVAQLTKNLAERL